MKIHIYQFMNHCKKVYNHYCFKLFLPARLDIKFKKYPNEKIIAIGKIIFLEKILFRNPTRIIFLMDKKNL